MIKYFLKKYPISISLIVAVIYLSFFRPPTTDVPLFPNADKLVHFCMYAAISGMLWFEFIRNHRKYDEVLWHAWIGATLCPILMGGIIEILQQYCTDYRGGDWLDFAANTCGVLTATLLCYFFLRPLMLKNKK